MTNSSDPAKMTVAMSAVYHTENPFDDIKSPYDKPRKNQAKPIGVVCGNATTAAFVIPRIFCSFTFTLTYSMVTYALKFGRAGFVESGGARGETFLGREEGNRGKIGKKEIERQKNRKTEKQKNRWTDVK